jgi:hypothetical protein
MKLPKSTKSIKEYYKQKDRFSPTAGWHGSSAFKYEVNDNVYIRFNKNTIPNRKTILWVKELDLAGYTEFHFKVVE